MDEELRGLLTRKLNSPLKLEAVRFFHQNFSPLSTAAGVSMWLGRSPDAMQEALDALVDDGVLARAGSGSAAIYSLTESEHTLGLVERLMDEDDSAWRLALGAWPDKGVG
jgi:hypothetical protein